MRAAASTRVIRLEKRLDLQTYRFLADRFVEGTCPHCGSDVSNDASRVCTSY